jgi:DNA-binding response OmpR family regulator
MPELKKKILVVDDDNAIVEAIRIALEMEGYIVDTTTKGEEAFPKAEQTLPDLILLDVLLNGIDGRDVARKLKDNERTRTVPIIMFSAHLAIKDYVKEAGAEDFIAKPFDIDELLGKVKEYIKS